MSYIKFNTKNLDNQKVESIINLCPFNAIEKNENGNLYANAACKLCKLCIKKSPEGCVELIEEDSFEKIDKNQWKGIVVFAEHDHQTINPVVFELLNKAKNLAKITNQPVYALWIGDTLDGTDELFKYGADKVYSYTHQNLDNFSILPYTNIFEDFVKKIKPSAILVGATNMGRSLGPRIAARLKTGMTADCTKLEMRKNSDLVQIRPAFGGNIMAQIITTNTRPQFCTVREKVFDSAKPLHNYKINIEEMPLDNIKISDSQFTNILKYIKKEKGKNIADSEVLIVIGRGLKKEEDKKLFEKLANKMGGMLASSRALVECGWMPPENQIGLSGKTVKPKLLITFGVSGAVQFAAGVSSCEYIVSVNTDKKAPIFDIAHVCIYNDMYEIAQNLIDEIDKMNNR